MISAIIMVALGSSLSEQMRLGTKTQNQLVAAELARVLVDRIRSTPFDKLDADSIAKPVRIAKGDVNDSNVYDVAKPLFDRALQVDASELQYRSMDSSNPLPISKFPGTVMLTIGDRVVGPFGPVSETKTATIQILWSEPGQAGSKQLDLKLILCRHGIQADR